MILIFNNISEEEEPREETEREWSEMEDASALDVAVPHLFALTSFLCCAQLCTVGRGTRKTTSPDWLPP